MEKYLYLAEHRFAEAWINGGRVPFYKASRYKCETRNGVFTPDENQVDETTFDFRPFSSVIKFGDTSINNRVSLTIDGVDIVQDAFVNRYLEDGLVVCLSNTRSLLLARKLSKVVCVRINDVNLLKSIIDDAVGAEGVAGNCNYTTGHKRNAFLKSHEDSWQDEYRLFWKDQHPIEIDLPPGIASLEFRR
ncbi:hypothetical protein [Lelliottia amnigena]